MKIVPAFCGIKKNSGFTLLELIISMGILMVLVSVLLTLFGQILDVQLESKATSSVDQNGRFIMARLTHDMQQATQIITPVTPGQEGDTLALHINGTTHTFSASSSGNLVLSNTNGTDVLNSTTASISAFSVTRLGNGDTNDTIRVAFTVTTRTERPSGKEQKSFQTTLGLQ